MAGTEPTGYCSFTPTTPPPQNPQTTSTPAPTENNGNNNSEKDKKNKPQGGETVIQIETITTAPPTSTP